jgi:hypothetical protein
LRVKLLLINHDRLASIYSLHKADPGKSFAMQRG